MVVIWPTPDQDQADQQRRPLAAGRDNNSGDRDRSGGGTTVAEVAAVAVVATVVAMTTEAPPGARVGTATRAEATAWGAATTAATKEVEEAMEVLDTVVGAETPARAAGEKGATTTPRVERTTRVLTELAAPAPRRTAVRIPTSLSYRPRGKRSLPWWR